MTDSPTPAKQARNIKPPQIIYQSIDNVDTSRIDAAFDHLFELLVSKQRADTSQVGN